jgi:hypothetical protein
MFMGENLKCNLTDKLNINTHKKGAYVNTISNKENPFKILHLNMRSLENKSN